MHLLIRNSNDYEIQMKYTTEKCVCLNFGTSISDSVYHIFTCCWFLFVHFEVAPQKEIWQSKIWWSNRPIHRIQRPLKSRSRILTLIPIIYNENVVLFIANILQNRNQVRSRRNRKNWISSITAPSVMNRKKCFRQTVRLFSHTIRICNKK